MHRFTKDEKLKALQREIALRQQVYPGSVKIGRMTEEEAEKQIAVMLAIAGDYMASIARDKEAADASGDKK